MLRGRIQTMSLICARNGACRPYRSYRSRWSGARQHGVRAFTATSSDGRTRSDLMGTVIVTELRTPAKLDHQGQEPRFFRAERDIILAVEGIQSLRIRQWIQFGRARCNGSVMPRARNAAFVNNFWVNLRCGAVRNEEPQPMHSSSCP